MCCHWIKKPKFNDVCVQFKRSNFCCRMLEMHSKRPRLQNFSRNSLLSSCQITLLLQVFSFPTHSKSYLKTLYSKHWLKVTLIYWLQSHWMREPPCLQSMHVFQSRVLIFMLSLGLLWVPWATLCFAQWANGGIPVNLLMTGQACLHGWWLLLPKVPLSWRSPLVDKLLSCRCCCSQLRGDWRRWWLLWLCFPSRRNTVKKPEERNVDTCKCLFEGMHRIELKFFMDTEANNRAALEKSISPHRYENSHIPLN